MELKKVLENVNVFEKRGNLNQEIKDITSDSRLVTQNSLFVCIQGFKADGNAFVDDAIKKGAKCIVTEKDLELPDEIAYVKVENSRVALAQIANNFFDYPSKKFNLIGVTGTNGKTTTTYLIKSILEQAGQKVGLIGTIENKIDQRTIPTERTTPDIVDLQRLFSRMVKENVQSVVMEVSSHALDLHRVDGSDFDIGVFTNLTQDHLDYHGTIENYLNAKIKLFKMCKHGIVNLDDKYGQTIIENANCECLTYSVNSESNLKADNIEINEKGVNFKLNLNSKSYDISVSIPGTFTVYNALAAIGASLKLGIKIEDIIKGLKSVQGVAGRSEVVPTNRDFTVIIDYAHTPDGIENILKSVNQYAKGRVVTLFGCGGDRDKTKRPIMGEIAGKLSDFCIITSDNPRSEEPMEIIKQIEEGMKKTNCEYVIIENRREAIEYALKNARKDDIIVLAGKGHETYQILKDKTIEFNEREIVKEILSRI